VVEKELLAYTLTVLPALEEKAPLVSVKLPSPATNAKTQADRMWNLETNGKIYAMLSKVTTNSDC